MPNLIKFGGTSASRQYGEMCTSHTFIYIYIFLHEVSRKALPKNTNFQVVNGLKCSTVGNLGS